MSIETTRLSLIPFSPQHLLAIFDGDEQFEKSFGLPAADGLRGLFTSGDVSPAWIAQLRATASLDPWALGFAIVDRGSRSVIGCTGFKGPPNADGMVELAYGIAPPFQGRGYATEAAEAVIAFAFADSRVHLVRAHTLPVPNASTRVLTKCGFHYSGEVHDPDDGLVWRWELSRPK